MIGSCFCGEVKFSVDGVVPTIYQCHCSMCRKVTSSSSNTAFIVPKSSFKWLSESHDIKTFRKPTGYRVDFCLNCGSTVPNIFGDSDVWIPAGLIDGAFNMKVEHHLCVASKAHWDEISDSAEQHDNVPPLSCIKSHFAVGD